LGVVDLRTARIAHRSEQFEDEHQSLAVLKGGKKVVTGTSENGLCIFSWGSWEDFDDRYPSLPESIEGMIKVSEDAVLIGCGDGTVRLVLVQPTRILTTVAELGDSAVEGIALSYDRRILAATAQENVVQFFDASFVDATAAEAAAGDDVAEVSASSSVSRAAGLGGSDFLSEL
jgi:WD repeat-containing protein 55